MLIFHPDNAHGHWKQVEGSYRSRRTPRENWDVYSNSPAAVETLYWKTTLEISDLTVWHHYLPLIRTRVNGLSEEGETILFYMNMEMNAIFAVIYGLYEYFKSMSTCPNKHVPILLHVCLFSPEMCPNAPGNECFSFCFPQVTSYHRIGFL